MCCLWNQHYDARRKKRQQNRNGSSLYCTDSWAADDDMRRWQREKGSRCNCARVCVSNRECFMRACWTWVTLMCKSVCNNLSSPTTRAATAAAPHQSVMTSARTHSLHNDSCTMMRRISMRLHHPNMYYSALLTADYSYICISTPWANIETTPCPYCCLCLQQISTDFIPVLLLNADFAESASE